ncbi:hypothetical protein LZG00_15825 [Rhodobacteraceae bacterium LMO-12]|nr:hypothetical protein [Rhodobacteraceae bacterium LMO-JJ12]
MAATTIVKKALAMLNTFERAGKSVSRVIVEGRKIEIVLLETKENDEFDGIDMHHGKT